MKIDNGVGGWMLIYKDRESEEWFIETRDDGGYHKRGGIVLIDRELRDEIVRKLMRLKFDA